MSTLRFERDGHVGRLVLNRPGKLNSFTIEMWRELGELGDQLLRDPDLRALVVIGEGRAFSSGIDTSVLTGGAIDGNTAGDTERDGVLGAGPGAGSRHADPTVDAIMRTQDAYTWLQRADFATIAAVRGYALGAGLQLALACDLRVVARGTKLGLLELKYGIIPDLGGTQRLPRLVGPGKAKELVLTAAQIDAEEALRIGLVEQVVADAELDDVATALAARIAGQPPMAVRAAKRAIDAAADETLADGLRTEAERQATCLRSDDMKEALTAFVEQRPPEYHAR